MDIMGKWHIAYAHHASGPSVDIFVGTIKDCMDAIMNELHFIDQDGSTTHFTITDRASGVDILTITINKA